MRKWWRSITDSPGQLALFVCRLLLVGAMVVLTGCAGDPGTGPVEVKWDRDSCERCRMVLSDRMYAAQVRGGPAGEKGNVYKFDDIGCAVIWLKEQPWREDSGTEIWVTDHRAGRWIDARTATYVLGRTTPMDYGLGAQDDPAPGGLSFAQARAHILEMEAQHRSHRGHGPAIREETAHE